MGRVYTALQVSKLVMIFCTSFVLCVGVFVSAELHAAESGLVPADSRGEKWCSPPASTTSPAPSSSPTYSSPSPSSSSSPVTTSPSSPSYSSPTYSPSPSSSSSPVSSSPSSPSYSSPTYSPSPSSSSPSPSSPTYSPSPSSSSSPVTASPGLPSYSSPTYSPSPSSSSPSPVSASPNSPSYSSPPPYSPSPSSSSSPATGLPSSPVYRPSPYSPSPSSGSSPVTPTPSSPATLPGPAAAPLPSSPSTTYPTTPSSPNCPPLAAWFTNPNGGGSPSWWEDQLAAMDHKQQADQSASSKKKAENTEADHLVGQEKLSIPGFAGSPLTPLIPEPASSTEPGTCTYWSSHTSSISSILEGAIANIISLFGIATGTQLPFGSGTTLLQALTNTRPDAYGALMRQGSASLINSYHFSNFAYTPQDVRQAFNGALYSQQAAAVQAVRFENANRGYYVRAP